MATVSPLQITGGKIRPGKTAGGCLYCDWEGPTWYDQTPEGVNASCADARAHLGAEHPEKVTHWDDLL